MSYGVNAEIGGVGRDRTDDRGHDRPGRNVVDDRQLRPVQPAVQQLRRDIDHGRVDLHVVSRPHRTMKAERPVRLVRRDLTRPRRPAQLARRRMRLDQSVQRALARYGDLAAMVLLEDPPKPIRGPAGRSRRPGLAARAELAQRRPDTRIDARLALVQIPAIDQAQDALGAVLVELASHRLDGRDLHPRRHRDTHLFEEILRRLPCFHRCLHPRQLLRPSIDDATCFGRQRIENLPR